MIVRKYNNEFIDKVYIEDKNLVEAMKTEIKELLIEFGEAYDLEEDPDQELKNCSESIMNLIFVTKYEW